jgi:hypothetical protein
VKYGGLKFLEAAHIKDVLAFLRWAENLRDRVAGFRAIQLKCRSPHWRGPARKALPYPRRLGRDQALVHRRGGAAAILHRPVVVQPPKGGATPVRGQRTMRRAATGSRNKPLE